MDIFQIDFDINLLHYGKKEWPYPTIQKADPVHHLMLYNSQWQNKADLQKIPSNFQEFMA